MPIAEAFFKDQEWRARAMIKAILAALVIGVALVLVGIFQIGAKQKKLVEYAEITQKRWDALALYNPQIDVPQVVDPDNITRPRMVVPSTPKITATPHPTPTATPAPTVTPTPTVGAGARSRRNATRASRLHPRVKPKPTPWYRFFKSTR